MKKVFFVMVTIVSVIMLSGCNSSSEEDVISKFSKKVKEAKTYHVEGIFELKNNEESYTYDIKVDYKNEDKYKVSLINKTNNHEQIILRNTDGVYVLTPSLNKSFKFQSDWPYNNSQTYVLQSILKDIENDTEKDFEEIENGYIITTSVNYSSKKELVKQNIYLDKDANITKVEVINLENQPKIIMNFTKVDYDVSLDDNIFNLTENTSAESDSETTVGNIDGIVFPMYVPIDTYLTSQDVVSTNTGERAILTFNGDKSFTIIQEASNNEVLSISVDGEPQMILDTVGVVSDSYVSWINNGIEYSVISDDLSKEELLNVANSISVMPVSK